MSFFSSVHPHARRNYVLFAAIVATFVFAHFYFEIFGEEGVLQKGFFSWQNIALTGGLGLVAVFCLNRTRQPGLWDPELGLGVKLWQPLAFGLLFGVVSIYLDVMTNASDIIAKEMGIKSFQAPFPASLTLYFVGAFFLTVLYYFVVLSPVMWLVGDKLLKGRFNGWVFWLTALPLALYEPIIQNRFSAVERFGVWGWALTFMGFPLPLAQLWFLRKGGLIASANARLGHYVLWHILYGAYTLYWRD